jgi:cytidyltransferase-like protein
MSEGSDVGLHRRIAGRFGIVDAYLASYLWRAASAESRIEVAVTGSLYPEVVPVQDLVKILAALRCVHRATAGHWRDGTELAEAELAELSRRHLATGRPLPCQVPLAGPDLRTTLAELTARYGDAPARRHQPLVAVSGCFDMLHVGHMRLLELARRLAPAGNLVAITLSDEAISFQTKNRLGQRPVYPEECRTRLLSAIRGVAHVLVVDAADCVAALNALGVNLYVKNERDRERPIIATEERTVAGRGGRIAYVEREPNEVSTTVLIDGLAARLRREHQGTA